MLAGSTNISYPGTASYSPKLIRIMTILIFFEWLIYENVLLIEADHYLGTVFLLLIFAYKVIFPFLLLIFSGLPFRRLLNRATISIYLGAFALFLGWSIIPSLISGSIISWVKLIPVFVLSIAVLSFFSKYPEEFTFFAKCHIINVLTALSQYAAINTFHIYEGPTPDSLTGPYGILGLTFSKFYLPGLDNPVIRLCGFWKEPSNAAGSAFAAFYMGRYLVKNKEKIIWGLFGFLCLITGFLTLSNAGYLAIGAAFFFGVAITFRKGGPVLIFLKVITVFPILILLVWLSLFSRKYIAEKGIDDPVIMAIAGVRTAATDDKEYDASSGREDLAKAAIEDTKRNIIGKGVQITGDGGIGAPAGAPLFWLALTGFPGLFLLLVRELAVIGTAVRKARRSAQYRYLAQAYICIIVQQSVYGSWMDPNNLIFASIILIGLGHQALHQKQENYNT